MLSKAERKAIILELTAKYRKELNSFGVHLVTGSRVVLIFAGVYEEFLFKDGEITRTDNSIPLKPADATVLFALARNVRQAVVASYKGSPKKRRNQIVPKAVKNKHTERKAIDKARSTHLYQMYLNWAELGYFNLQLVSGVNVDIRIGNHAHHFEYVPQYDVSRYVRGGTRLSREDFCFTCTFSRSLMQAAIRGYRSTQAPKVLKPNTELQLELQLLPPTHN